MNIKYFIDLDKYLAIIGIIFSIILIFYLYLHIEYIVYSLVGLFSFLSCIAWLIMRKKASLKHLELHPYPIFLILLTLFFILFTISLLVIIFRPELYTRPLIYFILISCMSGLVALEILFSPTGNRRSCVILLQIILIGLSITWSQILIFPSLVGEDPWWHQMFTLKILDSGFIPKGYPYSNLPLLNLGIAETSSIMGLDYKISAMVFSGSMQILCSSLFVFLIGRFLLNRTVGLTASLLIVVSNQFINMSFLSIPTTTAAVFIPIVLYLLFRFRENYRVIGFSLSMLLMIVMILTHTITSACMALILFVFYIAFLFCSKLFEKRKDTVFSFTIVIFFTVTMFGWWTYASGHLKSLVELLRWGFSVDFFIKTSKDIITSYHSIVPLSEQILYNLGMFLFFALSFVGCFYMISKKENKPFFFALTLAFISPLATAFFSLITGHSIVEHRWWYFSQLLLVIPLAITLILFCARLKNKIIKHFILVAFVIFLSFTMIISPTANFDNSVLFPNTGVRYALYKSELLAMEATSETWNETIYADKYYAGVVELGFGYKTASFCEELYSKNFTRLKNMPILIRTEIINRAFKLYQNPYKLDYNLIQLFSFYNYSKMYDCGSVYGFID